MATLLSTQLTNLAANPQTALDSSYSEGKERVKCFDWTADAAQNDTVQLCNLPKGARIIQGRLDFTAFGASVTCTLGDGTTANKYLTSTSVASAGNADFANTWAMYGFGREALTAAIVLTATLGGADPASGTIRGWIRYVVE